MGNHGSALIFPDLSHKLRHKMFFSSLSLFHLRESASICGCFFLSDLRKARKISSLRGSGWIVYLIPVKQPAPVTRR
jgi:hypothetical protein